MASDREGSEESKLGLRMVSKTASLIAWGIEDMVSATLAA